MGFCLFDNVAIAAELAIRELGAERVFVLDWDVHHGNGTAEAFRHRSDVLFVSIHQAGIYPGTGHAADLGSGAGEGYTINLPVPAGSDEETWLSLMEDIVVPAALSFDPDLVLVSAGFDAHRDDPLADCRLETDSFARMACQVRDMAQQMGAPLGAVLEGGYNPAALAESVDGDAGRTRWRGVVGSGVDQAVRERVPGQIRATLEPQLLLHVSAVRLHRAHAERELLGDRTIGIAESHQAKDLRLARGEDRALPLTLLLEARRHGRRQVLVALRSAADGLDQLQVRGVLKQVGARASVDRAASRRSGRVPSSAGRSRSRAPPLATQRPHRRRGRRAY